MQVKRTNQKKNAIKKNRTKKNAIKKNKIGGDISTHEVFSKILSIGYEFECGNMFAVYYNHEDDNYIIPSASRTEELLHAEQCVPEIGDYSCLIEYETDTPHAGNTTPSLLTVYEDILHEQPVKMEKLLNKCKLVGSVNNLFITHTELLFTFFNREAGCDGFGKTLRYPINKPNCIEDTFRIMLELLQHTFVLAGEEVYEDMKIIFFTAPGIEKPIYYGIPTTRDKVLTPQDIIWVPQMTYSVKPEDIMEVTDRLSIHLDKEERDIIKQCIANSNSIFKDYKKWAKEVGVEKENPLLEIFKNVLFFVLYYTHPYFFYDHKLETDVIHKNMFCFLFRHSVHEIFNFHKKKSLENGDNHLIEIVEYLRRQIRDTSTHSRVSVPSIETKWKSFVCSSFIKLQDDVDKPRFFGDIFSAESQYYEFSGHHVLIEFRCFHKNIIQTLVPGNVRKKDVHIYKTLNEWRQIFG